jgi:tRNA A-37 threonylcarbamoyl transferase component Bud32
MSDANSYGGGGLEGMWHRPEDLVGTVLADRYRVLKVIGDGGMGSVYLGEHVTIRKKVALKVLKHELCREQTHVDRFLQEARAASMIAHENVVDIVDFGPVPGGSVFFAMEFLEGEDLSSVLRRERRFPWARARELMLQVVRALKAAHARGIIHRDLKPANCFLVKRSDGRDFIKLLDFGIAKVTDETGESGGLTRTGAVFGTAKYMAPEQACGEPADARTDVYAAAICLYEFLTGTVPFDGDNFMRVLSRHLTEPLTLPSTMAPDAHISPVVESIVVRALAKRPEDRFQSMAEFEQALLAVGPDGRLSQQGDVGPAFVQRGGTQMQPPQLEAPGSTMWLGPGGGVPGGSPSQPPDARGGTMMLDPNAPHGQPGMEPGGTVRLGGDFGFPNIPTGPGVRPGSGSAPPPLVGAQPEATFMMDGMGAAVLPSGGQPITRNPPGAPPSTYPPAHRPASVPPETRPPTFAPDTMHPSSDATVFAVEGRSKVGFVLLLVIGAIVAVGGGGLVAWLLLDDPEEVPAVADKQPTAEPSKIPTPPPDGPVLQPKTPEPPPPEPDPPPPKPDPEPKTPDPDPPPKPDPDPPPKPDPKFPPKQPPKDKVQATLSSSDINKGLAKAAGAIKSCKGPLPITFVVKMQFKKDGRAVVESVSLKDGATLSAATKSCVKNAIESKARFPKHEAPLLIDTRTF